MHQSEIRPPCRTHPLPHPPPHSILSSHNAPVHFLDLCLRSFQDYSQNVHGKEIDLLRVTVKVPGKRPPKAVAPAGPSPAPPSSTPGVNGLSKELAPAPAPTDGTSSGTSAVTAEPPLTLCRCLMSLPVSCQHPPCRSGRSVPPEETEASNAAHPRCPLKLRVLVGREVTLDVFFVMSLTF